jgi:hypothetical protein
MDEFTIVVRQYPLSIDSKVPSPTVDFARYISSEF